ncbi:MAG: hypothetical protein JXR91_03800 [Deltaproteobacteria bacterium]|nr:hypothetical protein [Deltaproteobacteria bacterium]
MNFSMFPFALFCLVGIRACVPDKGSDDSALVMPDTSVEETDGGATTGNLNNSVKKKELIFPLGISDKTSPDELPWEISSRSDDEHALTIFFKDVWEYTVPEKGDLNAGSLPLFVDELIFMKNEKGELHPGKFSLVTPLIPEKPFQKLSIKGCELIADSLNEFASFFEKNYKDNTATVSKAKDFFSSDCEVINRNKQVWSLHKNGMQVIVKGAYEHRGGQLQITVEFSTEDYERLMKNKMLKIRQEQLEELEAPFYLKSWPELPFGHSMKMTLEQLPWKILARYETDTKDAKLVLLTGRKEEIELPGLKQLAPYAAEFILLNDTWQLARYSMISKFHNNSPYDCSEVQYYLHGLAAGIEKQLKTPGVKITKTKNFESSDCQILRFDDEHPAWTMTRDGVQIVVAFNHDKKRIPGDSILIEYTLLSLQSKLPKDKNEYQ